MKGSNIMIYYHSYSYDSDSYYLKASIDYYIQFKDANESYSITPPYVWFNVISDKLKSENYNFYKIYFTSVENNKVNRITDYQKVWGLMSLPTGIIDGGFCITTKKVYFGIDITNKMDFYPKCHIIVCTPKKEHINLNKLSEIIKNFCDGTTNCIEKLSQEIYRQNKNSYIVSWNITDRIIFSVYGNVQNIFSSSDFEFKK